MKIKKGQKTEYPTTFKECKNGDIIIFKDSPNLTDLIVDVESGLYFCLEQNKMHTNGSDWWSCKVLKVKLVIEE